MSHTWGTNFWPKFEILTVLGAVFPHFCPDKREIWHGGADLPVSPLWGKKPIFGPLSKNNTSMAALRAGLPVINQHNIFAFIHLMFGYKSTYIILSTLYTCNWLVSESRRCSTMVSLCQINAMIASCCWVRSDIVGHGHMIRALKMMLYIKWITRFNCHV